MTLSEERKLKAKKIVRWFTILTFGSGYILYLALRNLFAEMARNHRLVTFRTEGEHKAIMKGNSCERYIVKIEGYRYDPDGFDTFKGSNGSYAFFLAKSAKKRIKDDPSFVERKLVKDQQGNFAKDANGQYQLEKSVIASIDEANTPDVFEELFGVTWVGFEPYNVFGYPFRWLKYGQEKAENGKPSEKVGLHPRDEKVWSLYHRYPQYGIRIEDVETGAGSLAKRTESGHEIEKIRVKVVLVFETITTNAQKTLFRTAALSSAGDWQQALVREIQSRVRIWLGNTNWDELFTNNFVENSLAQIVTDLNGVDKDGIPKSLKEHPTIGAVRDYGQMIVKISAPHLDLQDVQLQQASEKVFMAERGRDAAIATAKGARATAAAPVLGKADGLKEVANIPGGKDMYIAEQLGKIHVYAPGKDGIFLNVSESITGKGPTKLEPEESELTNEEKEVKGKKK